MEREDLLRIKGIGPATEEMMSQYLRFPLNTSIKKGGIQT